MRKVKYLLAIILTVLYIIPLTTLASGSITVSTSNLSITTGTSQSFTITANNAAGRVDISTSNAGVASISEGSVFVDNQSSTITVTGKSAGTATIRVQIVDATTYDDEDITGGSYTINVTVSNPVEPTPVTPSNNNSNNNGNNSNNNSNNNNNNQNNKSTNNKVKNITIDGVELGKIDDNNYTATVATNVEKIKLNVTAEDAKATVTGAGEQQLKIGENVIEVVITSESGAQNKITVKVIRKDNYYLDDLENAISNTNNNINIKIDSNSKVTASNIEKIKKSGKTVSLNYSDNERLLYSWIIDGSEIKETNEFDTELRFTSDNIKEIRQKSNFAEGVYLSSKETKFPNKTRLKVYVGDKFSNGDTVNIYYYNNDELTLVQKKVNVKNDYIEFDFGKGKDYFVTMANLEKPVATPEKNNNLPIIIIIALVVVILILLVLLLKKRKKKEEILQEEPEILSSEEIKIQ